MVDFKLSDEQRQFQQLARDFAEGEVAPHAEQFDSGGTLPLAVAEQAWQLGLMNTVVPESLGGLGLSVFDACLMAEELAYACSGVAETLDGNNDAAVVLLNYGNSQQKEQYVGGLTRDFSFGCTCLVEPDSGFNFRKLKTTAELHSGKWVLNGQKSFVTAAKAAKWLLVWAHTPAAGDNGDWSVFVVPADAAGVQIGQAQKSLGLKACDAREVTFKQVHLEPEQLVGGVGRGQDIYRQMHILSGPRKAAQAIGLARAALSHALGYAQQRFAFGQPIAKQQVISFMLADMAKDIEAARLLTWQAAWNLDRGQGSYQQALAARTFASEMCLQVAENAVQIYGGYGYSREYPVEKLMRDAKTLQVRQATSCNQLADLGRQLILSYGA